MASAKGSLVSRHRLTRGAKGRCQVEDAHVLAPLLRQSDVADDTRADRDQAGPASGLVTISRWWRTSGRHGLTWRIRIRIKSQYAFVGHNAVPTHDKMYTSKQEIYIGLPYEPS